MHASGIILAGGKSSRMKYNKAFADIGGKTSLEIITHKFSSVFDETIIISNEIGLYEGLADKVVPDVYPRLGPVAGIHSGLYHARCETMFILGCDMPFINMDLVSYMLEKAESYQAVVPVVNGYLQPLSSVYVRSCLPIFTRCLEEDKLKLVRIFEELNALYLDESELEKYGQVEELFFNVNDEEALLKARSMARRLL